MMFIPGTSSSANTAFAWASCPAAVYQDHIRDLVVINRFTIATAQDLIHRRIVIAGVMPVML